jgi:hypothetical protein
MNYDIDELIRTKERIKERRKNYSPKHRSILLSTWQLALSMFIATVQMFGFVLFDRPFASYFILSKSLFDFIGFAFYNQFIVSAALFAIYCACFMFHNWLTRFKFYSRTFQKIIITIFAIFGGWLLTTGYIVRMVVFCTSSEYLSLVVNGPTLFESENYFNVHYSWFIFFLVVVGSIGTSIWYWKKK